MSIRFNLDSLRREKAPLYHQYKGQTKPQEAYVQLTDDGEISADYSGEIGTAMPTHVWHRQTLRWDVDPHLFGDVIVEALLDPATRELLERVHAGHAVEWDGNNFVGKLTADAEAASRELASKLQGLAQDDAHLAEVLDVDTWLWASSSLTHVWPGCESLDQVIERVAKEIAAMAHFAIKGDVRDALLTHAQCCFEEGQGEIGIVHLDALLANGRITEQQRSTYIEEQELTTPAADHKPR